MQSHHNAQLTTIGRESRICLHLDDGAPLIALSEGASIRLRRPYKWLARSLTGGEVALVDVGWHWPEPGSPC